MDMKHLVQFRALGFGLKGYSLGVWVLGFVVLSLSSSLWSFGVYKILVVGFQCKSVGVWVLRVVELYFEGSLDMAIGQKSARFSVKTSKAYPKGPCT